MKGNCDLPQRTYIGCRLKDTLGSYPRQTCSSLSWFGFNERKKKVFLPKQIKLDWVGLNVWPKPTPPNSGTSQRRLQS